ncbi:MAG: hypothetical protein U5N10_19375 [Gemmobacter sp.]|nr:hypothetical protein [Gemmobacter sp.]
MATDGGGFSKVVEDDDRIFFKHNFNNPAYLNSLSNNSVLTLLEDKDEFI